MQIDITFACRSCGNRSIITWDTADAGDPVPLECSRCRHVSGDLSPEYHYRESDQASNKLFPWQRVR